MVNGCYRTSLDDQKGQLRIVDDPSSCRSNEMSIHWSQAGPQGIQGVQGIQGIRGEAGATGAQGPKGATGATGASGSQGDKGETGSIGLTGAQGAPGEPGANGTNGINGVDGATGPAGAKGDQGDPGTDGTNGTDGAVGPLGLPGPQGPPGAGAAAVQSITVTPGSAVTIWSDQRLGTLSATCTTVPGVTFQNDTAGASASPLEVALSHARPTDSLAATRTLFAGSQIDWSSETIASLLVLRHGSPVDAAGYAKLDVKVLNEVSFSGVCRAVLVSTRG